MMTRLRRRLPSARHLASLLTVITIAVCASPAYSHHSRRSTSDTGRYVWRNVDIGGGGGFVDGIVFSPAQRDLIYARTDIGGAYRWDASARSWVALTDWVGQANGNLRGAESIAADPTNAQRVYIAAGTYRSSGNGAILRSYDQGRTWKVSPIPVTMGGNEDGRCIGERLDVDPDMPSILYFGSRHDGLWRSGDFGATWRRVDSFPAVPDVTAREGGFGFRRGGPPPPGQAGIGFIVFDTVGERRGWPTTKIFVGVASATIPELYESTDSGKSWQAVSGRPSGLLPQHGALDPDGNLYITYADQPGPNGIGSGSVWKFNTISGSWTDVTPDRSLETAGGGYSGLSIDAEHPATIMVSTLDHWRPLDEIFRSTDGGAHWVGISADSVRDATGAPWLIWGDPQPKFGWWIAALAIDPFNSNRALYGTGATIWGSEDVTRADSGDTTHWTMYAQGLEETAVNVLVSPPTGPHLISAVGDIGGFTHFDLDSSPPASMTSDATFLGISSIDVAGGGAPVVVRSGPGMGGSIGGQISTDDGRTWTTFASEPSGSRGGGSIAVSADGNSIVWASVGAPVCYSRDQGATWTPCGGLPSPEPATGGQDYRQSRMSVLSDRVNPMKIYAVDPSSSALYVSTDRGATFAVAQAKLPSGRITVKAALGCDGDLWLEDGGQGLYHSVDSGATFIALPNVPVADGIGFGMAAPGSAYPAVYLVGTIGEVHGVYRSDDEGMTWVRINDDQHQYGWIGEPVTGDPRVYGRVYLGTNGRGILYADPSK